MTRDSAYSELDNIRCEIRQRQIAIAQDESRLADAEYVLRWVYQQQVEIIPSNIHDLAARALDSPSLAHGMADDN